MPEEAFSLVKSVAELVELQDKNLKSYRAHPRLYPYLLELYARFKDKERFMTTLEFARKIPGFDRFTSKQQASCVRDMLLWDYVYGYASNEFVDFEFYRKPKEERLTYLGMLEMTQLLVTLTPKEAAERFFDQDKWTLYQMLKPTFHRDVALLTADGAHDDAFLAFVQKHPAFLVKLFNDYGGHGIHRFETVPGQAETALAQLKTEAPVILEEILVQSKEMAQLNPSSVNTLRVVTFMGGGQFEVAFMMLRIGRKDALVDNVSSGGIAIGVDPDTHKTFGKLYIHYHLEENTRHPDIGVELRDFELPDWDGLMATLALGVSLLPPGVLYCGWDLAHTDHGWCIIECNDTGVYRRATFCGEGDADYFRSKIHAYAALANPDRKS